MNVLIFFHILTMFIAFALTTGTGIAVSAIISSADVRAIRVATRVGRPLILGGSAMLIVGVLLGFGCRQLSVITSHRLGCW